MIPVRVIPMGARLLVLLAGLALWGCGGADETPAALGEVEDLDVDTTNGNPLDGVPRSQLERAAQPMSPAEAERLGIIDTTITVEPQHPASQLEPGTGILAPAPAVVPGEQP